MSFDEEKILNRIGDKLKKGEAIHIPLPNDGLLKIDEPAPFLIVYRQNSTLRDNNFTEFMSPASSSYIIADGNEELLQNIVKLVVQILTDLYNRFLILEIWISEDNTHTDPTPITIHINEKSTVNLATKLSKELNKTEIFKWKKTSALESHELEDEPPYCPSFFKDCAPVQENVTTMGIEIAPVYINAISGKAYPLLLRDLRAALGQSLRITLFEFIRLQTSFNISNSHMMGSGILDDQVLQIDRKLAAYSRLFDFLLLVTPINASEAWAQFRDSDYKENPIFHYRPIPVDPEEVKRRLYNLPIEDISDPNISFLFRDKRKEVDRMLNMMLEREKPDFKLSSLQVFGSVSERLLETAKALLLGVDINTVAGEKKKRLSAEEFGVIAKEELEWLQKQYPEVSTEIRISDSIEGILVSKGVLNISTKFSVSPERSIPLLQHEIGTHVVTYYNGKAQPLKLLSVGVPGYEELQEGLAVFAEYLCDGLTKTRIRTLAARVVAVNEMITGNNFIHTFRLLHEKYKFAPRSAFNISMRVFRGGGLTKDALYLKGFIEVIDYVQQGGSLEELLIGKIRHDYLPIIQDLINRKILNPPVLIPRYLQGHFKERIEKIKHDGNIFKILLR